MYIKIILVDFTESAVFSYLYYTQLIIILLTNFCPGYQRELTYKRKDGSYSAFGDRDKEGSCVVSVCCKRNNDMN